MVTGRAIDELVRWGQAASRGDFDSSEQHLRQFYHLGAALTASKEFQAVWRNKRHEALEPAKLQDACDLLEMIACVESDQLGTLSKASV
jgi:hypothetical protein